MYSMIPCHDDPRAIPVGSLGVQSMEGTDPCHDDPYGIPAGSLSFDSPEGEDPCHGDWRLASPMDPDPAPDGLRLSWTGDAMVKGVVYGEIFKRKGS